MLGGHDLDEWLRDFTQPIVVDVDRIVAWRKPDGHLRYTVVDR